MTEERAAPGPIRPVARADRLTDLEREDRARIERHQRAAPEALGAVASFRSLLCPAGTAKPLGCLRLYSRTNRSLVADRVALIHAGGAVLAQELAGAASIKSLSTRGDPSTTPRAEGIAASRAAPPVGVE
jgi:hypothetical protein